MVVICRPIFITPILSKVFEHMVSVRLGWLVECRGVLLTTKTIFKKDIGRCDALLCVIHTLQTALEGVEEARIVRIDFRVAFNRVGHQAILFVFCSLGVGGFCAVFSDSVSL